ncbi:MAG: hypothetical protein LUQ65_00870 [Candidatus Helarchaeota archaeon]|nr:hypothetical protein [Candidatus Helarchaeota archaeon]
MLIHVLRGITIAAFIFAMYWLLSIILFYPWQPTTPGTLDPLPYPFTIGDPEINIGNAFVYFFMYTFGIVGHLFTGGAVAFPFNWTYFWDNYMVSIYYFGFELCIIVAVISMILFVKNCNSEWSFRAFLFMVGMLILVTLTQYAHYLSPAELGLGGMFTMIWTILFTLFGVLLLKKAFTNLFKKNSRAVFYFCFAFLILVVSYTSAGLFASIPSFYFDSLSNSIINMNFIGFISNPIFLAAFFTFLFLEITYLTSYNYAVSKPALEREKAITAQLARLEQLGQRRTEALQARAELHSISISRFFSSEAFDFMREVIDRGVYDKEAQARAASLRDFQHLQSYLEDLYIKDPEAKNSLTAKGSLPSSEKLAKASLKGTGYRVLIIFLIIFLCFSPLIIFNGLALIPSPIPHYLEVLTIAAVIVIALPLVLLFPTIGTILKLRRLPKIEEEKEEKKQEKPPEKLVLERSGEA